MRSLSLDYTDRVFVLPVQASASAPASTREGYGAASWASARFPAADVRPEHAVTRLLTDDPRLPAEDDADRLTLPSTPVASGLARRFVTRCLGAAAPDLVDVAVLLTSELVTNAVLHGLAPIRLEIHRNPGTMRVEVHDAGLMFVAPAAAAWSLTDEGGRGLPLLDALATAWGSHTGAVAGGKVLWFEMACAQPDPPDEDAAPPPPPPP